MRALLDTHVLLEWFAGSGQLSAAHAAAIEAADADRPLRVSEISLWEIATLHALRRVEFRLPLRDWLERATAPPLVVRIGITPAIAAEVATLPETFHRDPADRILVASARVLGATLLTRDGRIIRSGLVPTV